MAFNPVDKHSCLKCSVSDKNGVHQLNWYRDRAQAGHPGFGSQQEQYIFFYSIASRPALAPTQPPTQYTMGNGVPTPYVFMIYSIRDNFIFTGSKEICGHYELTNLAAFNGLKWSITCN
jgi:hypothetical protein